MSGQFQRPLSSALMLLALLMTPRAFADENASTTLCRNFCDADAKQCRANAQDRAQYEVAPLDPNDFSVHSHPQAPHDDFSDQKKLAVQHAADNDRFSASQKCTATRMTCVQHCAAPVAPPPASAP